jgi:hypothetical protein
MYNTDNLVHRREGLKPFANSGAVRDHLLHMVNRNNFAMVDDASPKTAALEPLAPGQHCAQTIVQTE